jgi:hypothetical protein
MFPVNGVDDKNRFLPLNYSLLANLSAYINFNEIRIETKQMADLPSKDRGSVRNLIWVEYSIVSILFRPAAAGRDNFI